MNDVYAIVVFLCVCRGRSTHPGSVVHLSDNPVDVNRVSTLLVLVFQSVLYKLCIIYYSKLLLANVGCVSWTSGRCSFVGR